jgi:L-seryl-tRNA(Ser) seleniumtransferase
MPRPEVPPPSIDLLLSHPLLGEVIPRHGRERVKEALRVSAHRFRLGELTAPGTGAPTSGGLAELLVRDAATRLESRPPAGPRPVINATGVLLHTNLGRAPLAPEAIRAAHRASGFCTLELDLETGGRGKRGEHVRPLLVELFGRGSSGRGTQAPREALDALAVTNTAAALLLVLDTLANGEKVAVSRGELVAIGGDFRVPSILAKSGATLLEVGTTNKTTRDDYREALESGAKVILKVHPSNYRIVGFTEEVPLAPLAELARSFQVPLVFDAGSGAPVLLPELGQEADEIPSLALSAGADVVCFSGDKLLGGPQAGIIIGGASWISRAARNPLARALRPDKLALAALAATLDLHLAGRRDSIPLYRMLGASLDELEARAAALAERAAGAGLAARVIPTVAVAGGGSGAEAEIASRGVALAWPGISSETLLGLLRSRQLPIVARIAEGAVVLDLRTIAPEEDAEVAAALAAISEER